MVNACISRCSIIAKRDMAKKHLAISSSAVQVSQNKYQLYGTHASLSACDKILTWFSVLNKFPLSTVDRQPKNQTIRIKTTTKVNLDERGAVNVSNKIHQVNSGYSDLLIETVAKRTVLAGWEPRISES